jgi:hypothetical protein
VVILHEARNLPCAGDEFGCAFWALLEQQRAWRRCR